MKFIQNIVSCAAVVGLMLAATNQVRAGGSIVVSGVTYIPLSISAKANINNKNVSITEKEIVVGLGFDSKTTLAVSIRTGDVWTVENKTLGTDLTVNGYLTISNNQTGSTLKGNTVTYTGTVGMAIYSSPQFFLGGGLDAEASEQDSAEWLELSGSYTQKDTIKPGKTSSTLTESYSAKDLNGTASDIGFSGSATGSVKASGSGPLPSA